MRIRVPKKVLVESDVADSPLVAALRSNLPSARFEVVDRVPEATRQDLDLIEVVKFQGRFLKSCPGTRHYICCGYRILNFGTQCTINCSYCILQAYLNRPNQRLFGNTDEMLAGVKLELDQKPERLHRIGTGEFTDSLLLDPLTGLSKTFVPFFARSSNAVLELKTKTSFIGNLKGLSHGDRTIVSWSLNSEQVRDKEEPLSATLDERLNSARKCAEWGYFLAFHFDPLIYYPEWREGYRDILKKLFEAVDPARVVWISLGAFRFMPDLKEIIRKRHPGSLIPYGEFIRGIDGKMRYFRDIRVELYSFMADEIERRAPGVCVYLCMESQDIWIESLGFSTESRGGLDTMLDEAVRVKIFRSLKTSPQEGVIGQGSPSGIVNSIFGRDNH